MPRRRNKQPAPTQNAQNELAKQEAAKKLEQDLKWKILCTKHNALIERNPDVRCSQVDKRVRSAVERKQVKSLAINNKFFEMSPENYYKPLKMLLAAEEAHEHIDMRRFDQHNQQVREVPNPNVRGKHLYEYDLVGLSKGQPNLIPGDIVILDDGLEPERCEISEVKSDTIVFKRAKNHRRTVIRGAYFNISFVQKGNAYDRYAKNLDESSKSKLLKKMLFEDSDEVELLKLRNKRVPKIDLKATSNQNLARRLSKCNDRQKQAIQNILEAKCHPKLYILFGPPGTGKSFTVVEIVVQIYHRNPAARVLVCASSNNCVDDLAYKIVATRQVDEIIRLSSMTHIRSLDAIPKYFTKSSYEAERYRLVFATNMMASKLKNLFDWILVDESGHAHIPESLLPIAKVKSDGQVVLAGDPKQLGPVIKNHEAQRLGLGVSLLERMFKSKIYSRTKNGYNPIFITKLIESYRCDPRILGLCNSLFYEGELKCLGRTPPSLLKILKCPKPLVFSRVRGKEYTPKYSTSRQNEKEADICIEYVFKLFKMGLEPDQIGIITPYVLQRELLIEKFNTKLRKMKPKLDLTFKIPQQSKKVKATLEPLNGLLHTDRNLNDINFLNTVLNQLMLSAQANVMPKETVHEVSSSKPAWSIDWHVQIDTVDAMQGREKEVIIISTVRSPNEFGAITHKGFLTDAKRFNVAISRAKWLIIVVGHPSLLNCCKFWQKFGKESYISGIRF